jgi:uncharacterized repeat protein (TIGR01451 family)
MARLFAKSIVMRRIAALWILSPAAIAAAHMSPLSVTKASEPYEKRGNDPLRFAVPGADILYAITVSNAGRDPLDADTLHIVDRLPGEIRFYNGDVDDGGPETGSFEFQQRNSRLELQPGDIAFSNDGGATFDYVPQPGYDPRVTAVRLSPSGAMAANSSFTIRFRAQIR